ncbi:MAG: phenylalanine--tRNA ligase subunit alpha [Gemmatimonadetes bacterium]|jgi:phenylalanyl-tRNA synthetase alpha chain|nr:phenylalanine--tRNA ligase subunit alpha [Gemmatimonadota bacterium]
MTEQDSKDALRALEVEALDAIDRAQDPEALEAVRIDYLGRKDGRISAILRGLGSMSPERRPAVGQEANRVKEVVADALQNRERSLAGPASSGIEDLTLPGRGPWKGGLHPVTQAVDEIWHIFRDLGFTRARGPEADTEWYNFEALNTPLDHPAADEQDTLYLVDSVLLRSHTSPVQMRTMETHEPPIRIIAPGWVYRRDTYDATHTPAFMQVEGLVIDEGVTFVDFKATLAEFARRYWGPDTQTRFRPSFFPFTEPSAEVDVKRVITRPDGSKEETDWLEIMGAGMVDPAVLENAGYHAERYTGFAFGMGPARIAMLKHGVDDLRTFFENDVRFLAQFV